MFGSAHIFSDGYLDKEDNSLLQEVVFTWLTSSQEVVLNQIDAEDPEVRRGWGRGVSTPIRLPWSIAKKRTKPVSAGGTSNVQCVSVDPTGRFCSMRMCPPAAPAPLQISDYHFLPDTGKMAEALKSCLQESEEVPRDFTLLFDYSLHSLDMKALPDVLK